MKKMMFLFFLLSASALKVESQELIGITGAGIFRSIQTINPTCGDFEFVEGRLMFGHKFRVGPMGNYTWVYLNKEKEGIQYKNFNYKGRYYTLGLSLDYWNQNAERSYYFWINSGIRNSYDRGASVDYQSWQTDNLFLFQFGLRRTNLFKDWFGNSLFITEFENPIENGIARYSITPGIVQSGTPYKKGGFRFTYENGIRKFPIYVGIKEALLEPTIHVGYGMEFANNNRQYIEYGLGLAVGYFKEWHHELFKIKAFRRQDLNGYNPWTNDGSKPPSLQIEVTVNLLNLKFNK